MTSRVESYIPVDAVSIKETLTSRNKAPLQGNNILLGYDKYSEEDLRRFITFVIHDVNKIVVEKGMNSYFLLTCHHAYGVEEPFSSITDSTKEMAYDVEKIVHFVRVA